MTNQVYIAGPFFNEEQLNVIKTIEQKLNEYEIPFVSPRLLGNFETNVSQEKRELMSNLIFKSNVENIQNSLMMIAVIDDFDPGTVWEMGYYHGLISNKEIDWIDMPNKIYTITNKGYGMNIMLKQSTDSHWSLENIGDLLESIKHSFVNYDFWAVQS